MKELKAYKLTSWANFLGVYENIFFTAEHAKIAEFRNYLQPFTAEALPARDYDVPQLPR
jgi:hypothetical protein